MSMSFLYMSLLPSAWFFSVPFPNHNKVESSFTSFHYRVLTWFKTSVCKVSECQPAWFSETGQFQTSNRIIKLDPATDPTVCNHPEVNRIWHVQTYSHVFTCFRICHILSTPGWLCIYIYIYIYIKFILCIITYRPQILVSPVYTVIQNFTSPTISWFKSRVDYFKRSLPIYPYIIHMGAFIKWWIPKSPWLFQY